MSNRTTVESFTSVTDFLDSKCRNSVDSRRTYLTGLTHVNNFVSPKHTVETVLKALNDGQLDIYKFLDSFIGDQMKKVSVRTSRLNLAVLKSYLGFHGIDVAQSKFQRQVTLPKLLKEKEQPIDVSDIRKILLVCSNRRLKVYILVLASGGMRAVEALAIRLKDIDFKVSPTKIHIRKEYAKTRVARDIYISDEATEYLKAWIAWKYRPDAFNPKVESDDDLVFGVGRSEDPRGLYVEIADEFSKLLDLAGFAERKDNSSRHKITLHSFRRFVDSTMTDITGDDYAEWFLGHGDNSYYTKKEPYYREIYATKCIKYLTFLDYTTIEATGKNIDAQLSEKDDRITNLERQLGDISKMLYEAGILKKD